MLTFDPETGYFRLTGAAQEETGHCAVPDADAEDYFDLITESVSEATGKLLINDHGPAIFDDVDTNSWSWSVTEAHDTVRSLSDKTGLPTWDVAARLGLPRPWNNDIPVSDEYVEYLTNNNQRTDH